MQCISKFLLMKQNKKKNILQLYSFHFGLILDIISVTYFNQRYNKSIDRNLFPDAANGFLCLF